MNVLALSSSRAGHSGYLEPGLPLIEKLLGTKARRLAFIPFASTDSYDDYFDKVKSALSWLPHSVEMVHEKNAAPILKTCDGILVGGGNTFKLLHDLYEHELVDLIRSRVKQGVPYIGWSAGSNILGTSIGTTNDMPIIQPKSFEALGIFPFHINPHYFNQTIEGQNGETRDMRIEEFLQQNPETTVIAIPEGCALLMEGRKINYRGAIEGFHFSYASSAMRKRIIANGGNI